MQSIGAKDLARQKDLVFEQGQLIKELRLIYEHMELLDGEISQIVAHCQEGQIVTSIPGIGVLTAATIIATIGIIANFESAAALKSYFGWAPQITQSGTSLDRSRLTHSGVRTAKKMLYLAVWMAITLDNNEWARLYQRLVPLKCTRDEATRRYKGKGKVIGRIAGQMISMIFALLKADYELLSHLALGAETRPQKMYGPAIHRQHQQGQYQALKPKGRRQSIVQLPHH
ncbi:MAG TPA: transposase [Ktedonobacteraceae bacterium]